MTNNISLSLKLSTKNYSLKFRFASVALSVLVICLGCIVIFGWCFDIATLKSILLGRVAMQTSTALSFILGGTSVLLWHRQQTRQAHPNARMTGLLVSCCLYLIPSLVILFTLLTLIEYGFQLDLGTNLLSVAVSADAVDTVVRGRMSPNTALCFFWFNVAILFLIWQNYLAVQLLAVAIAAISVIAAIGHIYDITLFYGVDSKTGMAIHTATGLMLLALALLGTRADKGWMSVISKNEAGGVMARRLLPLVVIIPPSLGWMFWWIFSKNVISLEIRIALRTLLEMTIFSAVVWWTAKKLNAIDYQRQQFAEELKESEQQLSLAFDFAAIGKALVSLEGQFFKVNPALCQITGYREAELLQMSFCDITHPDDLDTDLEFKRRVLADKVGKFQREKRYIHKSGRIIWILLNVSLAKDDSGKHKYFVAQMQDITARKQAERDLQQRESILSSFYNSNASIVMGIVELVGNDLIHISGNNAAAKFFGLELQNLRGSSICQMIGCSEIADKWLDFCHQSQSENQPIYFEYVYSVESGVKYIAVNISPISYCDRLKKIEISNSIFSYVAEDITERKLAAIFKQKQVRIQEIHHRVKNSLQIICSLINIQSRAIQEPTMVEHLHEIKNRVQSIALIHEKLYQSENVEQINFSEYITDLTNTLFRSYFFAGRNIDLTIEITQIFWLDIDTAIPCGLIINELISNALKHAFEPTIKGEIKIALQTDSANNLVLIIADNGKGLPTNYDFKQSKTLGLKLVKNLTAQLRGTIEVNTDKGTQYTITLNDSKKLFRRTISD